MFGLPADCITNHPIDVKKLPLHDLELSERRRFRESVLSMTADGFASGEEMPVLVTDTLNVQKVQFISIRLTSIQAAPSVCSFLQRAFKAPTVLYLSDDRVEKYSFALKRLNLSDREKVVVTDEFLTSPLPVGAGSGWGERLARIAGFDTALNTTNLHAWYVEMMVKCFILTNVSIWSGMERLLSSKVWYDTERVLEMFSHLKRLAALTKERASVITTSEAMRINGELKKMYGVLEGYV